MNWSLSDFSPLLWLAAIALVYYATVKFFAWFIHWYAHKTQARIGQFITWRRKTDNVVMTGFICHRCGELTCIQPSPPSYKRMMRGEKYY